MTGKGNKPKHKWQFSAWFRRQRFGWRASRLACQRIREAVKEISTVAKHEPVLAGEGAVLLLERLSPALMQVDSSTGALGTAANKAIERGVEIIAASGADEAIHDAWCERLWQALEENDMYIEYLGDCWGTLCLTRQRASAWADRFLPTVKALWKRRRKSGKLEFFRGTTACLSALLAAARYDELLALLELAPSVFGPYQEYGYRALLAQGRNKEAAHYPRGMWVYNPGRNDMPDSNAALPK